MNICEEHDGYVIYEGSGCPVCMQINDLLADNDNLKDEINILEDNILSLESDIADLTGGTK